MMSPWLTSLQAQIKKGFPEECEALIRETKFRIGTKAKSKKGCLGYEIGEVSFYLDEVGRNLINEYTHEFINVKQFIIINKPVLRFRLKLKYIGGLSCFYREEDLNKVVNT